MKYLVIVLSLFFCETAVGQNILNGVVLDNGEQLEFVQIHCLENNKHTQTDSLGRFQLEVPSEFTIQATLLGFNNFTRKYNNTSSIEINLVGIPALKEVVVSASMKDVYLKDSPVKIEVISSKKIEKFLPSASTSLINSVELLPGVQEVVACGVCYTNSISINGLPGAYTAVLLDGSPMFGNLASVYGLNGIPNVIVDRYEIIKGPSSTLYGSEAVAGIINVITKSPSKQSLVEFDAMMTSNLESYGNFAFAPKMKKGSTYIGFNYGISNAFKDLNKDGFNDFINLNRYAFFNKWNFKLKNKKKASLSYKYYYEDRRNGVERYLADDNYKRIRGNDSIYGESIYTNRFELFGNLELIKNKLLSLDYSYSYHNQDSYYGSDRYLANQQIVYLNLLYRKQIKKHYLTGGATFRYQYYDDNTVATKDSMNNIPEFQYIPGVFLQDDWNLTSKTSLLLGGRLDYYNLHGVIFSPRLNLKHSFSDYSTIRINGGTGFKTVNLFTEDHAFVTGQRKVVIEQELQPEKSINGTINYNHIVAFKNSSATVDVDAFYTYFYNKIIPDYSNPSQIIYSNVEGNAVSYGFNLSFNQSFNFPLSYNVGFTYNIASEKTKNEAGDYEENRLPYAPLWSGVVSLSYDVKKIGLTLSYNASLTGNMVLPEVFELDDSGNPEEQSLPTTSKPFIIHTIQLIKKLKHGFTIYGGMENFLNYQQSLSPLTGLNDPNNPAGFSPYFDTAYAYSPIEGIEFFIGLKWTFNSKNK